MTREQLIASLTAGREDHGGVHFDDESYIDWSCQEHDPEEYETITGRSFEFGNDGDAIAITMTWDRIERLQRALTLLLLERDA